MFENIFKELISQFYLFILHSYSSIITNFCNSSSRNFRSFGSIISIALEIVNGVELFNISSLLLYLVNIHSPKLVAIPVISNFFLYKQKFLNYLKFSLIADLSIPFPLFDLKFLISTI